MELPGARGSESRAEITRRILSSERCNTSSGPCCKSCGPFSDATRPRAFHGASFALGLGPLDHVDMSAVDAVKQQNRGEFVVEPGHLPGELHARRATTTGQPRLAGHPVWIIGVRDETGNIVPRASVGATSVVGDRARVRRFRRIRNLRISGRPAQTAAALAEACGQAASHPRIGGTGVPSPGLSEQACLATSAGSISAHAARQANTAASRAEKSHIVAVSCHIESMQGSATPPRFSVSLQGPIDLDARTATLRFAGGRADATSGTAPSTPGRALRVSCYG